MEGWWFLRHVVYIVGESAKRILSSSFQDAMSKPSGCFKVHGLHAFLYLCVPGLHQHSVLAPLEIQHFRPLPEKLNQKLSSWPTDCVLTSSVWSSDSTSMGDRQFGSKNKSHFPFLGHLWSGRDFIFIYLFILRNCTRKSQLNG